ncbi:cyclic beta 1-2 glucan synthetase [Clostridium sp. WLY-B-L2]|uniref:Cyclic beta 1-2 glucan synthetase n=1 Tax=Clostridium aromativorans TaxID=2836848 RepID=A0ABS8N4Z4_9CLOT|nr:MULTISPECIES: glucoamylase family protein [Clostridium]KAA8669438.1 cyclic beta 1-2 glucan synthetase [Clostridium sp. HV4-5-A1G]MCC9294736.1 cyclic beta 1-2 glucan synthetase [Clostridium aromativorans]
MLYIISIAIIMVIVMIYRVLNRCENTDHNAGDNVLAFNMSKEELKKYAREIAVIPAADRKRSCKKKLMRSLNREYKSILDGCDFFESEIKGKIEVASCAEWLLDNLYLIKKEYKDIKANMTESYYRNLPVIKEGIMKGYPRIYYIAKEMLSHTYGAVDEDTIEDFINSYEENKVLKNSELWALPVMIRIALLQNISNITDSIVFMQKERNRAEVVAERIMNSGKNVNEEIEKLKREKIRFTSHFTEKFIRVLRDNFIGYIEVYNWIDEELDKEDSSVKRMVNIDHQKQGIYQVLMENSIKGIREVCGLNWKENFERLSYVERILKKDPAGIYSKMDFCSKDYYRHRIEKLSKAINVPESFIAKKAVECAGEALETAKKYEKHVGYYLIDSGTYCLKKKIKSSGEEYREVDFKIANNMTPNFYIGSIVLGTIFLDVLVSGINFYFENLPLWKYIIEMLVLLIPSSEIFISIFNWSINKLSEPRFIPKIEFKQGIPEEFSTAVVIPTLTSKAHRMKELIGNLEVYYLANKEKNLYFVLLEDFKDSTEKEDYKDKIIVDTALDEIKKLNEKYGEQGKDKFYFLSRCREYNEREKKWMGWERKRGKLMEFNALIRGDKTTSYDIVSGDIGNLYKVKYVITLDADTILPKDTAKLLIGAMAHPLNVPYLNNKKIIRGHGLMQPRISVGVVSANKTFYSSIFSGQTGIDVYTTAISDVYEDLFDEGIFTGKGIYDVDIFNTVLKDEIPENTVLSHDLLEGSYVRAALVTDIELIDGYPAYYNSSCKRLHRWVRGDWQLIPWIFKKSPLNKLSRWKIFDNLRRSTVQPGIMILIAAALTLFQTPDNLLVMALISLLCPIFFDVSEAVVSPVKGISLSGNMVNFRNAVEQFFLILSFLPYQAYLMLDAIIRTIYRMSISKRNLLQWQTAADAEAASSKTFKGYLRSMWICSAISVIIAFLAFRRGVDTLFFMLPFCIIWFLAPWMAFSVSREEKNDEKIQMKYEEKKLLGRISRKIWAYFEDFTLPENNWLPPDNYQEEPYKGLAYRTSPTNMAMGITSNIVAYDLGYVGIKEVEYRLENIILNMGSLEKHRGHFYNWYDIKTKKPLGSRYISTVDSGNLVGYIWVTIEALEEYLNCPLVNKNLSFGLKDTLRLAQEEIAKEFKVPRIYENFMESENEFNIYSLKDYLRSIIKKSCEINENYGDLYWNEKVKYMASHFQKELDEFFPWIDLVSGDERFEAFKGELDKLANKISLKELSSTIDRLAHLGFENHDKNMNENIGDLKNMLNITKLKADDLLLRLKDVKEKLVKMGEEHDFSILYDKKRRLFAIGYDVENNIIGNNYYDLLASEARQASFVAIAKGQVEKSHWFNLGRAMTYAGGGKALVSWSGTMFEYLMPLIIMKNFPGTLLSDTYKYIVEAQKRYADSKHVPWGISESAYYDFDLNSVYQYKAFGVPGIGLKRGLVNELVIAPYASIMALQVDFKNALNNVKSIIKLKAEGKYGFYDAIDYTRKRFSKNKKNKLVKCFMVHHEGMSFMSLDNILRENILQERFHRVPRVRAVELLLQEKSSKNVIYDRKQDTGKPKTVFQNENVITRKYNNAKTDVPEVNVISSGRYSLMITNSGSGYSKMEDTMLYRYREDVVTNDTGMFFYIKNINSNEYWSAAYEPCKGIPEEYEVVFSPDKSEFKRKDGNLRTHMKITVSHEDSGEIRKISITNMSNSVREVEITSYLEVTLSSYNADLVHPAFGKLFIQTEFIQNPTCIIAGRRSRNAGEQKKWLVQTIAVEGERAGTIQYETNRDNFIGRGRNLVNPRAMDNDVQLTKSVGAVIDPIISLRVRIRIEPGRTGKVAYSTMLADSKENAVKLANKYGDMCNVNRMFQLSWTEAQLEMKYLGITSNQINVYQKIASKILFLSDLFQNRYKYIVNMKKSQSALWPYGISGDLPIVLLIIRDESNIDFVRQLLRAQEYWTLKNLSVDLVLLNLEDSSYMQPLQNKLRDIVNNSLSRIRRNKDGRVFILNKSEVKEEDVNFLKAVSRFVIDGQEGELFKQFMCSMDSLEDERVRNLGDFVYNKNGKVISSYSFEIPLLRYFNDIGGFSKDGKSYIIVLKNYSNTPAPWINVISNRRFGFHISESGISYTWNKNSRENKLTEWSNDPVMDGEAESLYVKDEETGHIWSISPGPVRDSGQYVIEHGFGYSIFKHEADQIVGQMTVFADIEDSVKVCRIKLHNIGKRKRILSIIYYAKLVLGVCHEQTAQYIYTGVDKEHEYIYAKNPYSQYFKDGICYLKILGGKQMSYTGVRTEFIGRQGNVWRPEGLCLKNLSNTVGAGFDPCMAQNVKVELDANSEGEIIVLFGQEDNFEEINRVIEKYSNAGSIQQELKNSQDYWKSTLETIQVNTPDDSMNIMLNGWLMYQVISCRYWSRTAFYQSGGAYGFRDQLQDVSAISYIRPDITREHIIYSASRQYLEGDVQHWWHPYVGSGIRTKFSDDLLWMPYVVEDYIKNTGDYSILNEAVPYLNDSQLKDDEYERYSISPVSEESGTIYDHCIRAIEKSCRFGEHNIPLMGSGDWNDGMNTVGNKGKGESVWLGWFLYSILDKLIPLCKFMKDEEKIIKYSKLKEFIKENLEKNAWDGSWYKRAYFDDGTPLGSVKNEECQIDSISQSWAVISGAAKESRAKEAVHALDRNLIKKDKGIILLLTPAFDKSSLEPGYIKGYIPGVRENGGQYTHAAIWSIMAFAKIGDREKAYRTFSMINPINHAKDYLNCHVYKVEPYVVAADVYAVEPYVGRGGWSWYTGAAGWLYRAGVETILGMTFKENRGFVITPSVPEEWKDYSIRYNRDDCVYDIQVIREKEKGTWVDGDKIEDGIIPFFKHGQHSVKINI